MRPSAFPLLAESSKAEVPVHKEQAQNLSGPRQPVARQASGVTRADDVMSILFCLGTKAPIVRSRKLTKGVRATRTTRFN